MFLSEETSNDGAGCKSKINICWVLISGGEGVEKDSIIIKRFAPFIRHLSVCPVFEFAGCLQTIYRLPLNHFDFNWHIIKINMYIMNEFTKSTFRDHNTFKQM